MPHARQARDRAGHVADGVFQRPDLTERKDKMRSSDSLVNVTRPGYKIFSRSFSDDVTSTPFSPGGVAVNRTGAKGREDEIPSRVEREARVGLGDSLLPTGCSPGDAGLAKESSYG